MFDAIATTQGSQLLSWLGMLAAVTLAPIVALVATPFARVAIVLAAVRHGFGTPGVPPAPVVHALAALLAACVMLPVIGECRARVDSVGGVEAVLDDPSVGLWSVEPWRVFLERNSGEEERAWVMHARADGDEASWESVVASFMLTEVRRGLWGAALVLLPFVAIDVAVGVLLLTVGMHMMSPSTVSTPLKLLAFVGVNGWLTLGHGLASAYGVGGPHA